MARHDLFIPARDRTLVSILKEVTKLHFRGYNNRAIGEKLNLDQTAVARYVKMIADKASESENYDRFLSDTITRTMESIHGIDELMSEAWNLLEYCKEEVPQRNAMGGLIFETDDNGEPVFNSMTGKEKVLLGPRSPGRIPGVLNQIAGLVKQRAELLKLIGPKVDISIKLQIQEQTQARILETLKGLDPETYTMLYRQLEVITESTNEKRLALTGGVDEDPPSDFIEAEYAHL